MRFYSKKLLLFVCFLALSISVFAQKPVYDTSKPWAYWWWMGSAVSEEGIKKNLQDYAQAGLGGLHIIPIYGVKGNDANNIPFLSERWNEMLAFTVTEAQKLGLGIDLTMGTGWPFGGKHVKPEDAAKMFEIKQEQGKYVLNVLPTKQKVKRAAPGGEGWVLDHFSQKALLNYMQPFQLAFGQKNIPFRALYNDSYEVYGANWTTNFLEEFKQRRGYDLAQYLEVLSKTQTNDLLEKRIWGDYNATIADLCREAFTATWAKATHEMGKIARNEAHGSPGNMLDLYALSDIPETEYFGTKYFDIPYFRRDPDFEESRYGTPDPLVIKFATSAANVTGKKWVSSETATWLANHFKVSLSQVKPIVDESFTSGINHIFYHGIPYSPPQETYPGWLFYASTNFNQQSHFWKEFPALNAYIARCQSILQESKPDNDVLLYFPIHDIWHEAGGKDHLHLLSVHANAQELLFAGSFGKIARTLQQAGIAADYISDLQLTQAKVNKQGRLVTQGGTVYKSLLIPYAHFLPIETLEALVKLQKKGAKIIFAEKLPEQTAGFTHWEQHEKRKEVLLQQQKAVPLTDLLQTLQKTGVRAESLPEQGFSFIRKKNTQGTVYFISNFSQKFQTGTLSLQAQAKAVSLYDALHDEQHFVPFTHKKAGQTTISLRLLPGESVFVQLYDKPQQTKVTEAWQLTTDEYLPIGKTWEVHFQEGQPFLPKAYTTDKLGSWTDVGDSTNTYFTGTAIYKSNFAWQPNKDIKQVWLNLGNVRETAEVHINGTAIGLAWCLPFRLAVPVSLLKAENTIEIKVKNLSANRMRYIDKQSSGWKKFQDINIVDIQYKSLSPAQWKPEPSGLLSPIYLELY